MSEPSLENGVQKLSTKVLDMVIDAPAPYTLELNDEELGDLTFALGLAMGVLHKMKEK